MWPTPCVYMASLPLDANVQFMTVMATKMPFIGRGSHERSKLARPDLECASLLA